MKLPTDYQTFIHLSRYSRWLEEDNRRETWEETISRLVNYFKYHIETVSYTHLTLPTILRV